MSFQLRVATTTTTESARTTEAKEGAATALARAQALLTEAEEVFSVFRPQSPMSQVRRGELTVAEAPPEVAEVLALCRRLRGLTDGWFDPWALPGGVNPTGLVKGWAAARALAELEAAGVPAAMINAGGDVAVYGEPEDGQPWRVGVRHPQAADELLCVAEIRGRGAVATSGTYERGAHLLDPRRRAPAASLLSATVIGADLTFADTLATAVFVSGGELLGRVAQLGYHALIVAADGRLSASPGFPLAVSASI